MFTKFKNIIKDIGIKIYNFLWELEQKPITRLDIFLAIFIIIAWIITMNLTIK